MLREHGVDEAVIEQIRMDDRADFNSNRRFYRWTSDFGEYLEGMAENEQQAEPNTVADLLGEIEDEKLYILRKQTCSLGLKRCLCRCFFWPALSFYSDCIACWQRLTGSFRFPCSTRIQRFASL